MGATVTGTVFQIKRFTIHDGPGIRTTVFLKGCPMTCEWCHNPEGQSPKPEVLVTPGRCIRCLACLKACPTASDSVDPVLINRLECKRCGACAEACYPGARHIAGKSMTPEEVVAEIEKDRAFYEESGGGATFSGGEPLMQPDFLSAALSLCKARDIRTAVDTCGYADWEVFEHILPVTNLFLYDVKLMSDHEHIRHVGVSNERVLSNLRRLSRVANEIIIRTLVIPGITDFDDNWSQLRNFVKKLPRPHRVELLPFHRIGVDKYPRLGKVETVPDAEPPARERMEEIALFLRNGGIDVGIKG